MKKQSKCKLAHKAFEGIIATKWHDNSNHFIQLSNFHELDPVTKIDRYGFVDKRAGQNKSRLLKLNALMLAMKTFQFLKILQYNGEN